MIKLGEIKETGHERFTKMWLVKDNRTKKYSIMILDKGNGWFTAMDGTLAECRVYARNYK